MAMALLRTAGTALGTLSAGILVVGAVVVLIAAALGVGFWLLVRTFTTVGS
jgi:hypothetical protein